MDAQIQKKREEEWKSGGLKGKFTRLIEDSELPDVYFQEEEEGDVDPSSSGLLVEDDIGRGRRQPKVFAIPSHPFLLYSSSEISPLFFFFFFFYFSFFLFSFFFFLSQKVQEFLDDQLSEAQWLKLVDEVFSSSFALLCFALLCFALLCFALLCSFVIRELLRAKTFRNFFVKEEKGKKRERERKKENPVQTKRAKNLKLSWRTKLPHPRRFFSFASFSN